MKPYFIRDIDDVSRQLVLRPVDSEWLRQELLSGANRLRDGSANNLDLYDPQLNPTGCFQHQDVHCAFYELYGIHKGVSTVAKKIEAVIASVKLLDETPVVVIDPMGDTALLDSIKEKAQMEGRSDAVVVVKPDK